MKVVYTLRHRAHHPERELEDSRFQEPFEHPGRAEIIRAALAADERFEFVAPDEHGRASIDAVHDPGLVDFLETAWLCSLHEGEETPSDGGRVRTSQCHVKLL